MAGLNDDPHGLTGDEPNYDKLIAAYNAGQAERRIEADEMGIDLGESRPTHCFRFLGDLVRKDPTLKMVEIAGQADGMATLIRTEDGQAYEVTCKPAAYATHPTITRHGAGKGTARPKDRVRAFGPKKPNLP